MFVRSMRVELNGTLTKVSAVDKFDRMVAMLRDGCSGCEFDEAEGDLINHCERCRGSITTLAWELFS